MSRPPWGKVAGVSLTEGGNSLSILDCPTTNAPTPTTAVQKNSVKSEGPYTLASEFPLSEPSRAHLSPKGEAYLYVPLSATGYSSDCEAGARNEPSPFGEGGPRQRWKGGTR